MTAASVEPAYPRVAFQGELGAYGDAAIELRWRGLAEPVPARTFHEALAHVCEGRAEYAVIPVWNSTIGDLIIQRRALAAFAPRTRVMEDLVVPVRHCLLALPSASLDSVRIVGSHPAALAQCRAFFRSHPHVIAYEAFDTAGAARELAHVLTRPDARDTDDHAPWHAAVDAAPHELAVIASGAAARRYGLTVLAESIQDAPGNATRFAVVRAR